MWLSVDGCIVFSSPGGQRKVHYPETDDGQFVSRMVKIYLMLRANKLILK